jgi:hypothetical protein
LFANAVRETVGETQIKNKEPERYFNETRSPNQNDVWKSGWGILEKSQIALSWLIGAIWLIGAMANRQMAKNGRSCCGRVMATFSR